MANPLQPKVIKTLENKYKAFTVNVVASSKSGIPDVIACINGDFYGFEVKWGSDTPSELQKEKINNIIDAGGKAYFIHSLEELCKIIDENIQPIKYEPKNKMIL